MKSLGRYLDNIWVRIGIAILISGLLLIPVSRIENLIEEREEYSQLVKRDVSNSWSGKQSAGFVVLSIPMTEKIDNEDDKGKVTTSYNHFTVYFTPKDLNIGANAKMVIRRRGIYTVPVYESEFLITGNFNNIDSEILKKENTTIDWDKITLVVGVNDLRGVKNVEMKWNNSEVDVLSGKKFKNFSGSMIYGSVQLKEFIKAKLVGDFSIKLDLLGSSSIEFYPLAEKTSINISANWKDPSFKGAYLPQSYDIQDNKFQAEWNILGITTGIPLSWGDESWISERNFFELIEQRKFGVDLYLTLDDYQLNTRSIKYSFLFIVLTFITMFFVEILTKLKFHPMHYGLTGAGLVLFYLLQVSLSEYIGFSFSYGIGAIVTIFVTAMYIKGVTRTKKGPWVIWAQLSSLYGFMYVLLKQENFTLIYGTTGLWVILIVLMFLTRKIDWFNLRLSRD